MLRHVLSLSLLYLLVSVVANAEEPRRPRNLGEVPRIFSATCDVSLSSAAAACTIQQPSTGSADNIRLISAVVYCAAACTVQQERSGTVASTTEVTVHDVNGKGVSTTTKVLEASNVGSGVVAVEPINVPAASEYTFDFTNTVYLIGAGATKNYTFRSSTMTGQYKVTLLFEAYN